MLYPQSCRPRSLQTSSFYIVKLLEDLPDDDHIADVRTEWYSQDLVDPLLFTTRGKEHIVSKDGTKETVNVKWIADNTMEIEEIDYYIYLALLHASEDKVLSLKNQSLPLMMIYLKERTKPTCNTADPKEAREWQQRQVTFCFIKQFKAKSHLNLFFIIIREHIIREQQNVCTSKTTDDEISRNIL